MKTPYTELLGKIDNVIAETKEQHHEFTEARDLIRRMEEVWKQLLESSDTVDVGPGSGQNLHAAMGEKPASEAYHRAVSNFEANKYALVTDRTYRSAEAEMVAGLDLYTTAAKSLRDSRRLHEKITALKIVNEDNSLSEMEELFSQGEYNDVIISGLVFDEELTELRSLYTRAAKSLRDSRRLHEKITALKIVNEDNSLSEMEELFSQGEYNDVIISGLVFDEELTELRSLWERACDIQYSCRKLSKTAQSQHGIKCDNALLSKLEKIFNEGNYKGVIRNGEELEAGLNQLIDSQIKTEALKSEFEQKRNELQQLVKSCSEKGDTRDHSASLSKIDSAAKSGDYSNAKSLATRLYNKLSKDIESLVEIKEEAEEKFKKYRAKLREVKSHVIIDEVKFSISPISQLMKSQKFEGALKQIKALNPQLTRALNQKPVLEFDFPQGLVAKEWNKVSIEIRNTGCVHVDDVRLDFDGLDHKKTFAFNRIEAGEAGTVIGGLFAKDPGSLEIKAEIRYSTHKESDASIELEEWLEVLIPGTPQQRIKPEIKVSKPVSKAVADYRSEVPEWNKPTGLKKDDAILLEFFERRWLCYSKWPKNKLELDYLHNNQKRFPIESYFEIPTDPSTVLHEWGLPKNLRGNVFLDKQRNSHVRQILASPIDTNFVIIGEPGVGKTTLLYEVFDSFMDKIPTGILTTSSIGEAHVGFGSRLFYDDIPENPELVAAISDEGAKGLVVSAREADWKGLSAKFKKKFQRLSVPLFSDKDIVSLCHRMLDFSNITYDDAAIEQLKDFAQGSPIFVWSLIREMSFADVDLLTNTYVKNNSREGMESYVSLILKKLLKDGRNYKPGGLHTLGCLLFLSEYMKDKKCHESLFRSFAEIVEPEFEEKFGDRQSSTTFNQTIESLSGKGSLIRFPHDTWADVLEGSGDMNPFRADIQDIKRKIADTKYEKYRRLAVIETWEQAVRRYRRRSVRERDSFLALSDILTSNFTLSELEKDLDEDGKPDVDIEMMREVCSLNTDLPIAARVLSRIQAAKPTQVNKIINIRDSVINRPVNSFNLD